MNIYLLYCIVGNEKGPLEHISATVKYLSRFGHSLTILISMDQDLKNLGQYGKCILLPTSKYSRSIWNTLFKLVTYQIYAFWILFINYRNIDVIYLRQSVFLISPVIFSLFKRKSLITEVNGFLDKDLKERKRLKIFRKINRLCEKFTYSCSKFIVCVSNSLKNEILKNFNIIDQNKVVVIYNGSEKYSNKFRRSKNEIKQKLGLNLKRFYLVYVGMLSERENVSDIIYKMKEIVSIYPNINLLIIGDGSLKNKLIKIASKNHLLSFIEFKGYLPHKKMIEYISACDIGIFNKKTRDDYLGFQLKIVDYLAAGIPVVGPISEDYLFIQKNKLGILYDYDHEKGFMNAVIKILNDRKKVYMNEFNCKRYFENNLTWKGQIKKVDNLILESKNC